MFVRLPLCSVIVLSLLSCVVAEQQPTAAVRSELAPDQVLSVDQLSAIHFGTESAGKWRPYRVDRTGPMGLAPVGPHAAEHLRTIPKGDRPRRPQNGHGLAHRRQPLSTHGQRAASGLGTGPLRSAAVRRRPGRFHVLPQAGKNAVGVEVLHYGMGDGPGRQASRA